MSHEERAWFDRTVAISDQNIGTVRHVSNAAEAGRILTTEWKAPKGRTHRAACKAVLEALHQFKDRETKRKAREAFAEAARDAGIDA